MSKPKKKPVRIIPKYIKDSTGKCVEIYLDIEAYNAAVRALKKFDRIIAKAKSARKKLP